MSVCVLISHFSVKHTQDNEEEVNGEDEELDDEEEHGWSGGEGCS